MDEARRRDQGFTGPEYEDFVTALPDSRLNSNGSL